MEGVSVSSVFWYAPFDNAGEMAVAEALARSPYVDLTVQSISERFGQRLEPRSHADFTLVRNLPPPASERSGGNTVAHRAWTAMERSARRKRLVGQGSYDLVHLQTFNPVTDWSAVPRLKRAAPVLVQSVHNVRPHQSVFPHRLETVLLGRGYRACSALVVAHDHLGQQLIDDFDVDPTRVHTIPFPITMPLRSPLQARGVSGKAVNFLFFGTFRPNKGLTVLLDAIRQLDRRSGRSTPARFVIAGRGDADLEAKVRVAARELKSLTAEIGYVTANRRQQLYDDADCVLLPYTSINAQSGVLYDAYSQRLPVIASDVGPIGTTVRKHRSGWVVDPDNAASLVDALLSAGGNRQEMTEAGNRGAAIAEGRTPQLTAKKLELLYNQLLGPPLTRAEQQSGLG